MHFRNSMFKCLKSSVVFIFLDLKYYSFICFIFIICRDDAERLAAKLKKVTVADITESMEVSVMPFTVQDHQTCSIYKLKMKLYEPALYPPHTGISLEDSEETLEAGFVRELEDSIQNHLLLLSKISGIKNFLPDSRSMASKDTDEDASGDGSAGGNGDDDDDDDGEDDGGAEDLGSDAQKRKNQALDEMDYGDSEGEPDEGEPSTEIDHAEDEVEISKNEEVEVSDNEEFGISDPKNGTSEMSSKSKSSRNKKAKPEAKRKKRSRVITKEYDRAIFVEAKGTHFEAHFRFTNEPHILLAQVPCSSGVHHFKFIYDFLVNFLSDLHSGPPMLNENHIS